jgi:hypothetical protein
MASEVPEPRNMQLPDGIVKGMIVELLGASSGISAAVISRRLNLAKRQVNAVLYRYQGDFRKNHGQPPLWSLSKPTNSSKSNLQTELPIYFPPSVLAHVLDHPVDEIWCELNLGGLLRSYPQILSLIQKSESVADLLDYEQFPKHALIPEIRRSLEASLSRGLYVDSNLLIISAGVGPWRDTPCSSPLLGRSDRIANRFKVDLDLFEMRSRGETLEVISRAHGLTRERIRQRLLRFKPYADQVSMLRLSAANSARESLKGKCHDFLRQYPGCSLDQLADHCAVDRTAIAGVLPQAAFRFLERSRRVTRFLWTDSELLEAIRQAATFEYPLTSDTFDELIKLGEIRSCSSIRIMQRFGLWKTACESAGVESRPSARQHYEQSWTQRELIEFVAIYLVSPNTSGTFADFSDWLRTKDGFPSAQTVRNRVGAWSECLTSAFDFLTLESFRSKYHHYLEMAFEG